MRRPVLLAFSAWLTCSIAAAAATFTVTNVNSSGPGSLAQAITDANASPGADRIEFNIPGDGIHTIFTGSTPLPAITDAVTIDGYTQPGSSVNTSTSGSDAVWMIQIDAADDRNLLGGGAVGIEIQAPDCVIRGLRIVNFRSGSHGVGGGGIFVDANGAAIDGNFLGVDASTSQIHQQNVGILVRASKVTVGGDTAAARNVISGNDVGVHVETTDTNPADDVAIIGNQIGSDVGGPTPGIGNRIGIALGGLDNANHLNPVAFHGLVVGGVNASEANVISGNDVGVSLIYGNAFEFMEISNGALIEGNAIGLQPHVSTPAVNQRIGVEVHGTKNAIGGLAEGAGNTIAYNQTGVAVIGNSTDASTSGNEILSNEIFANATMDIDLIPVSNSSTTSPATGPTSNDFGDADTGPNKLQNFPVITGVTSIAGSEANQPNTRITGLLNSTASTQFTLQFYFYNLDPTLLGSKQVQTDSFGNAAFTFDFSYPPGVPLHEGAYYTATATDADGNTSEFMPKNGPVQMANISTRGLVGTGENILIGGFIVTGDQSKRVAVRALGPSLNVPNKLSDPYLELYDGNGTLLAKNDDWRSGQQQEISDAGLAPQSDVESALIATLAPGNYTAQVSGANNANGNGIVEVYDLDAFPGTAGRLLNLSTRGFVGSGDDVLIGGVIVRGDAPEHICVRAIGPDLAGSGVAQPLLDPTLELHDASGTLVAANDDWRQTNGELPPSSLEPGDNRDAVITTTLAPAAYTAVIRGKNNGTGLALVELYDLTQ